MVIALHHLNRSFVLWRGTNWPLLEPKIIINIYIYIYICITKASETPTIFHISPILKKKKQNVIEFFKTRLCLFLSWRLCLYLSRYCAFSSNSSQLPLNQTHGKPIRPTASQQQNIIASHLKTHHTHQQTSSSSESISFLRPPIMNTIKAIQTSIF